MVKNQTLPLYLLYAFIKKSYLFKIMRAFCTSMQKRCQFSNFPAILSAFSFLMFPKWPFLCGKTKEEKLLGSLKLKYSSGILPNVWMSALMPSLTRDVPTSTFSFCLLSTAHSDSTRRLYTKSKNGCTTSRR